MNTGMESALYRVWRLCDNESCRQERKTEGAKATYARCCDCIVKSIRREQRDLDRLAGRGA